jgi:hypothetical protein
MFKKDWVVKMRNYMLKDIHNTPPVVPVFSQMHPVHNFSPYFPNIQSNITLPSTPRSSALSLRFNYNQNFVRIFHLCHASHTSRQSHPPWYDHPNNIWWSIKVMRLIIMQSSLASLPQLGGYKEKLQADGWHAKSAYVFLHLVRERTDTYLSRVLRTDNLSDTIHIEFWRI